MFIECVYSKTATSFVLKYIVIFSWIGHIYPNITNLDSTNICRIQKKLLYFGKEGVLQFMQICNFVIFNL